MKKFNLLPYLFVSLITYVILTWWMNGKAEVDTVLATGDIGLRTSAEEYVVGSDVRVELQNNTTAPITLPSRCPDALLDVYRFSSEGYQKVENTLTDRDCSQTTDLILEPGKATTVSLLDYSYSLFGETGKYKITLELAAPSETNPEMTAAYSTPDFDIEEPGLFKSLWRSLIYVPLLNLMVAILAYTPGHSLALGIILLTLVIRTLLLVPSQKAMKAQKRMQEIQPKIEELKKKYANDQARLSQETMMLWKTHKVNPLSSCLPLLIQFPILIALYYAINGGLSPDRHVLLYPFLSSFSLSEVDPNFLGFNLFERSLIVFPILTGALQFIQLQLMNIKTKKSDSPKLPNEMQAANNVMKYMMPVMITIFTSQLPAAVGLYWAISTSYGIVQQLVVNNGSSGVKSSPEDDVEVRVVHRNK
jgi:YidC/Oxa1 family membrane protein insertase